MIARAGGGNLHALPGRLASADVETWLPNGDRLLSNRTLLRSDGSVARRLETPGHLDPSPKGTRAAYEEEGGPVIPNACDPDVFGPAPAYARIGLVSLTTGASHPLTQP